MKVKWSQPTEKVKKGGLEHIETKDDVKTDKSRTLTFSL